MSVRQVRRAVDRPLTAVVEREFRTALRNRALVALSIGFVAVVVGLAWSSGPSGYLPLTLDLLTPVEVLVPTLAFAFAYRSILDDGSSGELEMIRTYPVSRRTYVLGVYLGRAAGLLSVVLVALALAGVLVPFLGGPGSDFLATHQGVDSWVLYLRFVTLTAGFAMVVLAVAVAISAVAGSGRVAVGLAVGAVLVLVIGIDLGILVGLTGGYLGAGGVEYVLALSPNSAFRGLVLETVLGVTTTAGISAANPLASVVGLLVWWIGGLGIALLAVWPDGFQ